MGIFDKIRYLKALAEAALRGSMKFAAKAKAFVPKKGEK